MVLHSFKTGYRHVDSARVYRNEIPCADAIETTSIPRSDIFFTSKIPSGQMGYEEAKAAINATFKETGLDYVDLYLIHAPYGGKEKREGSWRALVEAKAQGRIRSIGVSNYGVHHLEELKGYISQLEKEEKGKGGEIDVGQWELHPWCAREDIVDWCQKHGVVIEAYSPLTRGVRLEEPVLLELGKKYKKTSAQILMRWSLQKVKFLENPSVHVTSTDVTLQGFVPLPKSVTPKRIEENADVYDFELTASEMDKLRTGVYAPTTWDPTVSRD